MLTNILSELQPYNAQLIAVSKTKPSEAIQVLYEMGQRDFGENYVQEVVDKQATLPNDIRWHVIGHLQTNKVKYIAPFVAMIHSVDSEKLLQEVQKQAQKHNRIIPCLLQFFIASEATKTGFSEQEAIEMLQNDVSQQYPNVQICGVMGMASFTDDTEQVRQEFRHLKRIFDRLKQDFFQNEAHFKEISMGMSDDYRMALEEGSTMIRVGSLLFGKR